MRQEVSWRCLVTARNGDGLGFLDHAVEHLDSESNLSFLAILGADVELGPDQMLVPASGGIGQIAPAEPVARCQVIRPCSAKSRIWRSRGVWLSRSPLVGAAKVRGSDHHVGRRFGLPGGRGLVDEIAIVGTRPRLRCLCCPGADAAGPALAPYHRHTRPSACAPRSRRCRRPRPSVASSIACGPGRAWPRPALATRQAVEHRREMSFRIPAVQFRGLDDGVDGGRPLAAAIRTQASAAWRRRPMVLACRVRPS